MHFIIAIWGLLISLPSFSQYKILNKQRQRLNLEQLADSVSGAGVVLYGELHNDSITHVLQQDLAKLLLDRKDSSIILGGEFFEADDQIIINEYLSQLIEYRHLTREAKLWPNFEEDYKPLLDLSLSSGIPFIATNIPRRYASMVARFGMTALDGIDKKALQWITPLPFEVDTSLPGYKAFYEMGHGGGMDPEKMIYAQAIKDATMAHFIEQNLNKGELFLHVNGAYHSNHYEGIYWYLKKKNPEINISTISTVYEGDSWEFIADFIIVVPRPEKEEGQK